MAKLLVRCSDFAWLEILYQDEMGSFSKLGKKCTWWMWCYLPTQAFQNIVKARSVSR
jgi:hypothetical protein